jgi:hypothetical protein
MALATALLDQRRVGDAEKQLLVRREQYIARVLALKVLSDIEQLACLLGLEAPCLEAPSPPCVPGVSTRPLPTTARSRLARNLGERQAPVKSTKWKGLPEGSSEPAAIGCCWQLLRVCQPSGTPNPRLRRRASDVVHRNDLAQDGGGRPDLA